jgi:hypothetical protein
MSPTLAWFPSPQMHFLPNRGTVEAMLAGSAVELSDQLAGRGEHDRVESDGSVGLPSSEGILGDLGEITDVKTATQILILVWWINRIKINYPHM